MLWGKIAHPLCGRSHKAVLAAGARRKAIGMLLCWGEGFFPCKCCVGSGGLRPIGHNISYRLLLLVSALRENIKPLANAPWNFLLEALASCTAPALMQVFKQVV